MYDANGATIIMGREGPRRRRIVLPTTWRNQVREPIPKDFVASYKDEDFAIWYVDVVLSFLLAAAVTGLYTLDFDSRRFRRP